MSGCTRTNGSCASLVPVGGAWFTLATDEFSSAVAGGLGDGTVAVDRSTTTERRAESEF